MKFILWLYLFEKYSGEISLVHTPHRCQDASMSRHRISGLGDAWIDRLPSETNSRLPSETNTISRNNCRYQTAKLKTVTTTKKPSLNIVSNEHLNYRRPLFFPLKHFAKPVNRKR